MCSECGVRCRAENREDAQGPRPRTARCLPLAELHRLCAWNPSDLTSLLGDKGRVTQLSAGRGREGREREVGRQQHLVKSLNPTKGITASASEQSKCRLWCRTPDQWPALVGLSLCWAGRLWHTQYSKSASDIDAKDQKWVFNDHQNRRGGGVRTALNLSQRIALPSPLVVTTAEAASVSSMPSPRQSTGRSSLSTPASQA